MSKVTKYLLKRISQLETELFSVKNRNSILEDEIIGLEDEVKSLNMSLEDIALKELKELTRDKDN